MKTNPFIKSLPLIFLSSIPASAVTIYVDLGETAGTGGGNWNTLSPTNQSISNLIDWDTGLPTTISIGYSQPIGGPTDYDAKGTSGGWNHSTPGNWVNDNAVHDAMGNDNFAEITFGDVPKDTTYIIELVSFSRDPIDSEPQDITVQTLFADRDVLNTGANGDDWQSDTSLNGNWLIWDDVLSQGGAGPGLPGEIRIIIDDEPDQDGFNEPIMINAIRLRSVTIPEPSSALLSIVALGTLLGRRSRTSAHHQV